MSRGLGGVYKRQFMGKTTLPLDPFEELKNAMIGMIESNRDIVESNLRIQESHEERMKELDDR